MKRKKEIDVNHAIMIIVDYQSVAIGSIVKTNYKK